MRHSFCCRSFNAEQLSRRHAIKVGGLGLLGLTLPGLLRAEALLSPAAKINVARVKSVVFLFQYGGPSHLDMFDMKPGAPDAIRGPHQPVRSSADGIEVSERLPKTARIM